MMLLPKIAVIALCLIGAASITTVAANADQRKQTTPTNPSVDSRFVGHYYLSGVMETGSELLLKSDGTYDWMLVVGGLDLFSEGKWARGGDHILLTPTPADKSAPLFSIEKIAPWNEAAEENAQESAMVERNNARLADCRFLQTGAGGDYTDAAMSPPYRDVTPSLVAEAEQAQLSEADARAAYEQAAAAAMASRSEASHEKARSAHLNWRRKRDHMRQAQSDARLPFVRLDEPILPPECVLENWPIRPGDIPKNEWLGGVAVHVGDRERQIYFNDMPVRFGLESGATLDRVTESGGIAWVPPAIRDRVTSITIIGKEESRQEYSFAIEPTAEGFLSVNFDSHAVAQPAFTELVLKIDGNDLVGFDGRGRYSRPKSN